MTVRTSMLVLLGCWAAGCASSTEPVTEPTTEAPTATAPDTAAATAEPAATQTPATSAPEVKVSLEDAAKKYVAESSAAWAAKDAKKQTALYTPDAVVALPGPKGLEEAKATDMEKGLASYFTAFPDLKLTYTRVVGKGNLAVAEWVFTGTNKGEHMGKPATNKKVGYRGASVLTFAPDGRVKHETVYFDMGTMMGQLGLGPKGAPVRPVEATPTAAPELMFAKDGESPNEAVARSWFSTSEKGDAKALMALASDDIVVSNQYMPADTKGKKALEKETAEGSKAFTDQKTSVVVCVPAGDLVACEYSWQATWKGPAMGMKPTGKTGNVHSLEVLRVKDGKVAQTTAYANGVEFASSFGLMDEKPAGAPPAKGPAPKKSP
ncbi:MAG: SnoaL-like domain-containing protein [Polyangiaceae bacterium]|nr:SnoaL-like domain-containing protein [Polyangiaceae bacterium]